jgi:hypothetical protein
VVERSGMKLCLRSNQKKIQRENDGRSSCIHVCSVPTDVPNNRCLKGFPLMSSKSKAKP